MTDLDLPELEALARGVMPRAHAPYSRFHVGAAVRAASGLAYVGCNVENASFGATICAERNAIGAAIAAGEREIVAVAVHTEAETPAMPCGICRQVIQEFGAGAVIVSTTPTARKQTTLAALLPEAFVLER
ncbi:MAG: cytidine deaminase [Polyangiaceae bacterium]|nr:cytidine deaminase [Myxococcales bacterium]MCC6899779.1 cytidine deaminase [Polyangiaceae bacterium]